MTLWPALLAAASFGVLTLPAADSSDRLRRVLAPGGMAARARLAAQPRAVIALLAVIAGAAGGLVVGVLVPLAAVTGLRVVRWRRTVRSRTKERTRALESLAVLSGDLRAGRAPADALAAAAQTAVGETGAALASAASAARLGGDVPAALGSTHSAVPEVLRGLAACWAVCSVTGSGLSSGVQRLEEGLRAAEGQRRAVEAELAGPRATASLLAALPVAGVALAAALGADPLHVLLRTPAGVVCLTLGLTLDVVGALWARRLVDRAMTA